MSRPTLTPAQADVVARWSLWVAFCIDASVCGVIPISPVSPDRTLLFALTHPAARASLIAVVALSGLHFASAERRWRSGIVSLAALVTLAESRFAANGFAERHLFYGAAALVGWLAGAGLTRGPNTGRLGRQLALAALAAVYTNAGLSKLLRGGPLWGLSYTTAATVLEQQGGSEQGLAELVVLAMTSRPVGIAAGVVSHLSELAAFLMPFSRLAAVGVSTALIAMHAVIAIGTHTHDGQILFPSAMLLLVALALLPGLAGAGSVDPPQLRVDIPKSVPRTALAAGLLAFVLHPLNRYEDYGGTDPVLAEDQPGGPLRRLGPLMVDSRVGAAVIERLVEAPDAVVVSLRLGSGEEVAFRASCEATGHGRFDVGDMALWHEATEASPDAVAEVGVALHTVIAEAVGDRDACARLAAWRSRAR
ncbi:MAG: hypothetical protein H6700_08870 [Myxococcales bacterium]|nr:hypothetical protein [Myxococcales bacterium]MCB9521115.1 hypothetical protein [Myxococcales bacterium]MCB9531863.1 hypothetical protein [Myxococcales bacterium]